MIKHCKAVSRAAITAAALIVLLSGGGGARAAEYFVSPGGSDSAPGTAEAPKKTITAALEALSAGDTLTIASGTYHESISISIRGTSGEPVVIRGVGMPHIVAPGGDGITIAGSSWVTVEGLAVTGAERAAVAVTGSDNIIVRGMALVQGPERGFYSSKSRHITVERCEISGPEMKEGVHFSGVNYASAFENHIHSVAGTGIRAGGKPAASRDELVTGAHIARNRILHCGAAGGAAVMLEGAERSRIESNVIDGNLAGGIISRKNAEASGGAHNTISANMVRFEAGKGLYGVSLLDGSRQAAIEQNIIGIDAGPAVKVDAASAGGFRAARNFYVTSPADLVFSWRGRELDFDGWREATGQDASSHVMMVPAEQVPVPPGTVPQE